MSTLLDDDKMPFGKFQGKFMKDVPAWWLLWFKNQKPRVGDSGVRQYINDNLEILEKENAKKHNR